MTLNQLAAPGKPGTTGGRLRRDYVLPGALAPYADESLPGLIMRNATRFRFHDPRRVLSRLRLPDQILPKLCQGDPAADTACRIRRLLDVNEEAFRCLTLGTKDVTTVSILGHPVWRELVRPDMRAVCPLCLNESGHHRAVWFVDLFPVCVRHGVLLIDHCPAPECGRPLVWSGRAIHECGSKRCRFDLRTTQVVHVDPERLTGIVALERLLQGKRARGEVSLDLPFGPALKLALILGKMSFGFDRRGRPPGFIRREFDRIPEILGEGWRALDNWPNGFRGLLDTLKSRATQRAGKGGLRKAFGSLSTFVYEWAREPWGAPIGLAFAEYSSEQPDLATTPQLLSRYTPGAEIRHRYVSISAAQRELGISPAAMIGIATRLDLFVLESRGGGLPSLLRADRIRTLKDALGRFLLVEEARALLGVGRPLMEQLEVAGLFRRVPIHERIMESRMYLREEVARFVNECVKPPPTMTKFEARRRGLTPLQNAVGPGRSMADLCRALREGRLNGTITVSDASGLASVRVSMKEVSLVLPLDKATLSMEEVGTRAGINYSDLHVWAKRWLC